MSLEVLLQIKSTGNTSQLVKGPLTTLSVARTVEYKRFSLRSMFVAIL